MTFKILKLVSIKAFILLNTVFPSSIYSNTVNLDNLSKKANVDSSYIRNLPSDESYILGSGDKINLKVYSGDIVAIDQTFSIDGQGLANLKRLKKIFIKGLTIQELTNILNDEYKIFVKNTDVVLEVKNYRPIRIYIDGEVDNPGMYNLPGSSSPLEDIENFQALEQTDSNNLTLEKENIYFPSVFDAIRKTNGISMFADLNNVEITRINPLSNGGGRIKTEINLLSALNLENTDQNIRIYDGDTIMVPKSDKPAVNQISKAIKSNLNPKFINVFLQGRVNNPGVVKLPKTSTLNEALTVGGGTKVLKGPIVFLRYLNDGTLDRRTFRLNNSIARGSYKNPYLLDGDLIFIGKGALTSTSEVISDVTSPLQGIFSSIGFFKILFD